MVSGAAAGLRADSADRSPDAGTLPSAVYPIEIVARAVGSDVTPVASDSRPWSAVLVSGGLAPVVSPGRPQTAGLTSVFAVMRAMTLSRPARRHMAEVPADEPPDRATAPAATGGRELVLAARPAPAAGDRVTAMQRTSEFSVQAAASTPTVSTEGGVPVGAVVDARAGGTQAGASNARIDLDELVDRAWQKLMRKVTIERERRGYTRWPWQS